MRFACSVSNLFKGVGTKQPDADCKVRPQACVLHVLKAAQWWKMVDKHSYCHCGKYVSGNSSAQRARVLSKFTPSLLLLYLLIFRCQESLGEMPSQTGSETPFCKQNTGNVFDRSFLMTSAFSVVCLGRYVFMACSVTAARRPDDSWRCSFVAFSNGMLITDYGYTAQLGVHLQYTSWGLAQCTKGWSPSVVGGRDTGTRHRCARPLSIGR